MKIEKAVLVYQGGIANVFAVDCFNMSPFGRNARRLMQRDFKSCRLFASGLAAAGVKVITASCNQAGDIAESQWTEGVDDCPCRNQAIEIRANLEG